MNDVLKPLHRGHPRSRKEIAARIFVMLLLTSVCGCSTKPDKTWPVDQQKAGHDYGVIALSAPKLTIEPILQTPARGAASGAVQGAMKGIAMDAGLVTLGGPLGFLIGFVFSPVIIGGSSAHGAAQALPAKKVSKDESIINAVITRRDIQSDIREAVQRQVEAEFGARVIDVGGEIDIANSQSKNQTLSKLGIDSILEVRVVSVGLKGPWDINPPLNLFATVQIRMIRVNDGEVLLDRALSHKGPKMTFAEWAAEDGKNFNRELDIGIRLLAEEVVDNIFIISVKDVKDKRFKFNDRLCRIYIYSDSGETMRASVSGYYGEFTPGEYLHWHIKPGHHEVEIVGKYFDSYKKAPFDCKARNLTFIKYAVSKSFFKSISEIKIVADSLGRADIIRRRLRLQRFDRQILCKLEYDKLKDIDLSDLKIDIWEEGVTIHASREKCQRIGGTTRSLEN